jgi:hypothetical protein
MQTVGGENGPALPAQRCEEEQIIEECRHALNMHDTEFGLAESTDQRRTDKLDKREIQKGMPEDANPLYGFRFRETSCLITPMSQALLIHRIEGVYLYAVYVAADYPRELQRSRLCPAH